MADGWLRIASIADVPLEGALLRRVDDHPVCLYNIDGVIFATDDICTHGNASLADGFIVDGNNIECPLHQGRFHIPTGRAVAAPCIKDIRTYTVKVDADTILLKREEFEFLHKR